jgi:hypothetical protein
MFTRVISIQTSVLSMIHRVEYLEGMFASGICTNEFPSESRAARASPGSLRTSSYRNVLIQTLLSRRATPIFFMRSSLSIALLLSSFVYSVALTGLCNHWSDPYSLRPNPLYTYARSRTIRSPRNISTSAPRFSKSSNISPSRTWSSKFRAGALQPRQDASRTTEQDLDTRPTPEPTGEPSIETTIFITGKNDFALLLPATPGGMFKFVLVTSVGPRSNPHYYRAGIRRRKQRKIFLYS